MSSRSFKGVYYYTHEADMTLEAEKIVIEPKTRSPKVTLPSGSIESASFLAYGKNSCLQILASGGKLFAITNITPEARADIISFFSKEYHIEIKELDPCISGTNEGKVSMSGPQLSLVNGENPIFNLPFSKITEVQKVGHGTDFFVSLQQDPTSAGMQLQTVRFFVPKKSETDLESIVEHIQRNTDLSSGTETFHAELSNVGFSTPRGIYKIRFCDELVFIHNETVNHRIPYRQIFNIHRLDVPQSKDEYVVISLSRPIRQGQTTYNHLVISIVENEELQMTGMERDWSVGEAIVNLFEQVGSLPQVPHTGFFENIAAENGVPCAFKSKQGYLYITAKAFLFVVNPVIMVLFENVVSLEFEKYDEKKNRSDRSFRLVVREKSKKYIFDLIPFSELYYIFTFLDGKNMRIEKYDIIKNFVTINRPRKRGEGTERIAKIIAIDETVADLDASDDEEEDENFNPDAKGSNSSASSSDDETASSAEESDAPAEGSDAPESGNEEEASE